MSIWKPDPQAFLQRIQGQKLHKGAINKILYTILSDNKNYLISCSSDKTVIVYSIDENKVMKTQKFGDEVMDVKLVKDFNKKRVFIISLKDGKLIAVNEAFNELFEIPSRFKTSITRHVIPLKNPNESDTRGDLLAITEGKIIDVFTWIKEGSIHLKGHPNPNNEQNINPQFQFSSPMFGSF
jgi:WD40 repeat protein